MSTWVELHKSNAKTLIDADKVIQVEEDGQGTDIRFTDGSWSSFDESYRSVKGRLVKASESGEGN